jgi:hypothetical protein
MFQADRFPADLFPDEAAKRIFLTIRFGSKQLANRKNQQKPQLSYRRVEPLIISSCKTSTSATKWEIRAAFLSLCSFVYATFSRKCINRREKIKTYAALVSKGHVCMFPYRKDAALATLVPGYISGNQIPIPAARSVHCMLRAVRISFPPTFCPVGAESSSAPILLHAALCTRVPEKRRLRFNA